MSKAWVSQGIARLLAGLGGVVLAAGLALPALAQPLPAGFFDEPPLSGDGEAAVEADTLIFDSANSVVTAEGRVALAYNGYEASGNHLVYYPNEGRLYLRGQGVIIAPNGVKYEAEDVEVTGGMKNAILKALTITTPAGSTVTAADANFVRALETVMIDATYSPCGLCIDSKGRRIGWDVKTAKLVYDAKTKFIHMDQVNLSLVGIPVAWLPFLSIPDPTDERFKSLKLPSVDYESKRGLGIYVPYQINYGEDTDVLLSAKLLSRQGALLGADVTQRFDNGVVTVSGAGIYQLDPGAYAGTVGDREWRGLLQSTGRFTPTRYWTAGWRYVTASDAGFPSHYDLEVPGVSEVYVEHLSRDHFGEVRIQQFNRFSTYDTDDAALADLELQGRTLPNARYESVIPLDDGNGQVNVSASLLNVYRARDHLATAQGVPYAEGQSGFKSHAMVQLSWQNQYIVGSQGLLVSPYLGLRGDGALLDTNSAIAGAPASQSLFTATPIAALDVRWPLIGAAGDVTHVLEPIAQLVYRGADQSVVGITNDNAHSFVFDDSNLFSFNRFSGSDRQETGLRANVGGRYQATLTNGAYLDILAGQSFHLAGSNGMAVIDGTQTGNMTGLENTASYVVLGANAGASNWALGAKTQIDPDSGSVMRTAASGHYMFDGGYDVGANFFYAPEAPSLGIREQSEVTGFLSLPLMDYWRANVSTSWDIAANSWLETSAGIGYDDGYLYFGGQVTRTGPTHSTPDDTSFTLSLRLKGPDGTDVGVSAQ